MEAHRHAADTKLHHLALQFKAVRDRTLALTAPLSPEDQVVQSMTEASPTKWHLAHTTWFFEVFVLRNFAPGYCPFDPAYHYLFNSYYEAEGPRHPRPRRGMLTRPPLDEILRYRAFVDEAVITAMAGDIPPDMAKRIVLGLNHEEQHQELLLMDIKHVLAQNPLKPAYKADVAPAAAGDAPDFAWVAFDGGLTEIGHQGDDFAFDNEGPRHKFYVHPFALANRPATNGDYLQFIDDGGYERAEFWLSDGWLHIQDAGWTAPLYWEKGDSQWTEFTLAGPRTLNLEAPLCHVSYYEADAFARWAGARLPTEQEWEAAAPPESGDGNFMDSGLFHPSSDWSAQPEFHKLYGDIWEWTASPYAAYPGFKPTAGAIGEYNGKFMCNQFVLRGGACVTPAGHIRATYRNFFPPASRWMFAGLRLARDV